MVRLAGALASADAGDCRGRHPVGQVDFRSSGEWPEAIKSGLSQGQWHRDPVFGAGGRRNRNGRFAGQRNCWILAELVDTSSRYSHLVYALTNVSSRHTPQVSCFGSIPNMAKWHKRPEKATLLAQHHRGAYRIGPSGLDR